MENEECVFCELLKIKDNTLYEDSLCFAVPDRYPSEYGHMLVISKVHHENMFETPDESITKMFLVSKKLGKEAREKLGADGVAIATNIGRSAGQIIPHFHIHVIPKYGEKRIGFMPHKEISEEEARALQMLFKL